MGKQISTMTQSVWTTGAGIVIGTAIDVGGVLMGSAASTVTITASGGIVFSLSGGSIMFDSPIALDGAVTGTSSGGSFSVVFRKRTV